MPDPRWLFLVGAAKAGTTSAAAILDGFEDVSVAASKEPHWFADIPMRERRRRLLPTSQADYLAGFDPVAGWWVDASTSYLADPGAPRRIRDFVGGSFPVLVLLRDPVARIRSHLLMDHREGLVAREDWDALVRRDWGAPETGYFRSSMYVELSEYGPQLARWIDTVGREHVHVLFLEEVGDALPATLARFAAEVMSLPMRGRPGEVVAGNEAAVAANELVRRAMAWYRRAPGLSRWYRSLLPPSLRGRLRGSLLRPADSAATVTLSEPLVQELREHLRPSNELVAQLLGRPLPDQWGT